MAASLGVLCVVLPQDGQSTAACTAGRRYHPPWGGQACHRPKVRLLLREYRGSLAHMAHRPWLSIVPHRTSVGLASVIACGRAGPTQVAVTGVWARQLRSQLTLSWCQGLQPS